EMKEAQELQLRQQLGRGSKWLTRLLLAAFTLFAATVLYFKLKTEMKPGERVWFIALVIVAFIGLQVFKRMTRRKTDRLSRLDVSERELVFANGDTRAALQWSALAQCLESPNLFVLVHRSKQFLYTVPKRVFPDEAARDWFRAQASQPQSVAPTAAGETFVP